MKKYILTAIIILLVSGCTSMKKDMDNEKIGKVNTEQKREMDVTTEKKIKQLETLNDWFSYPVAQNKIQRSGNPIIQPYSRGGIYFEVYFDPEKLKDYDYYDHKLHVDLKWKLDELNGTWERTANSKTIREGLLYINPAYKVGMYYYPGQDGAFDVFKVRIKFDSDNSEDAKPEPAKPEPAKPKGAKK
jgi:hypothetical protein